MNYLEKKINKYIINEIQTNLSLSKYNVEYYKDICMNNLIDKTFYLNDRLKQNICYSDDFTRHDNLENFLDKIYMKNINNYIYPNIKLI